LIPYIGQMLVHCAVLFSNEKQNAISSSSNSSEDGHGYRGMPHYFQSSSKKWRWWRWAKWFRSGLKHNIVCPNMKATWNKKIETVPANNLLNRRPEILTDGPGPFCQYLHLLSQCQI
jgi:hypothetical protein